MNGNKTKKSWGVTLIVAIVTFPIAVVGFIVFGLIYFVTTVIPAPIEYLIFKHSAYCKELKGKYIMGITHGFGYKSYKYVKANPRLTYVLQDNGYYYYKTENAVIVVFTYGRFYLKENEWYYTLSENEEEEKLLPFDQIRKVFEPLISEDISGYELKLIVSKTNFLAEQIPEAKNNEAFVFCASSSDLLNY